MDTSQIRANAFACKNPTIVRRKVQLGVLPYLYPIMYPSKTEHSVEVKQKAMTSKHNCVAFLINTWNEQRLFSFV